MSAHQRSHYSTSLNDQQTACKGHLCLDNTIDEDLASFNGCGHSACSGLNKANVLSLSGTVVSLTSSNGDQMNIPYAGIIIRSYHSSSWILTSANVIRSSDDSRSINFDALVHVNLPNGESTKAWMGHIDYKLNIAVVRIKPYPHFGEARLHHHLLSGSYNKSVVAVWRCQSGKLMHSIGVLTGKSVELNGEKLMHSTCIIDKSGIGGPLIDFDGNFVGINLRSEDTVGTLFIPVNRFREVLVPSNIARLEVNQGGDNATKRTRTADHKSQNTNQKVSVSSACDSQTEAQQSTADRKSQNTNQKVSVSSACDSQTEAPQKIEWNSAIFPPLPKNAFTDALTKDLRSRSYPIPRTLDGGMQLRNGFEEEFSEDVKSILKENVAANISLSVVSLASFKVMVIGEERRIFACTGVLIGRRGHTTRILTSASLVRNAEENDIDCDLKVKVYLPNNRCVPGRLQHYDLQYNIAVVAIRNFHCRRTAKLEGPAEPHKGVVAIGRTFETGKLMATKGILTSKSSEFDCRELQFSSCKITKAGIGGPLIDIKGNFVGMNFYGAKKTPYLPKEIILEKLRCFDKNGATAAEVNNRRKQNKWPVPEPYWFYPSAAPRSYFPKRRKF